ncbi:MAG: hypothetical protein R8P61_02650 [Bacteroidia bacterium]|nr:hypothetical protein [Bacteroidia bacterium]
MKRRSLLILWFILPFLPVQAQDQAKTFSFKKGEVMDLIYLSSRPDSEQLFEHYKKTAFPIAFEYSYQPQRGFAVKELTLGMNLSKSLIVGKWANKEKREGFLNNIVKRVPDFHQQRRKLFEEFALTYYVMPEDLEFSVEGSNFHVATSFWQKDRPTFTRFIRTWKKEVQKAGGKFLLELTEGNSPTGYYFNPELFLIIEWPDRAAFDAFAKAHPLSTYEALKHVHQVVIQ